MVNRDDQLVVARRFELELILLGIMISMPRDGARVRKVVDPEIVTMPTLRQVIKAIGAKDRPTINDFFATLGVNRTDDDEDIVTAILRVYLQDRKCETETRLKTIMEALKSEADRPAPKNGKG